MFAPNIYLAPLRLGKRKTFRHMKCTHVVSHFKILCTWILIKCRFTNSYALYIRTSGLCSPTHINNRLGCLFPVATYNKRQSTLKKKKHFPFYSEEGRRLVASAQIEKSSKRLCSWRISLANKKESSLSANRASRSWQDLSAYLRLYWKLEYPRKANVYYL